MNELLMTLTNDLYLVLGSYLVLFTAFLSNTVLSLYFNLSMAKEYFDKQKLLNGFSKVFALIVGTLLLMISVELVKYCVFANLTTSFNGAEELVTVAMIITVIGGAIFKYIKDAYDTLVKILSFNNE